MGAGGSHHDDAAAGVEEFTEHEIGLIDQIFQQMAIRSPDDTISKETFLDFFELPGVLGERLFEVFDAKKNGVIDFEEFMSGYHKFVKGSTEDKLQMLFNLFDLDSRGGITREELSTVLLSIVTPPQHMFNDTAGGVMEKTPSARSPIMSHAPSFDAPLESESGLGTPTFGPSASFAMLDDMDFGTGDAESEVSKIVEKSFEECDTDRSDRLSYDQFRLWLEKNPELLQQLEELFVVMAWDLPTAAPKGPSMLTADMKSGRFSSIPTIHLTAERSLSARGDLTPIGSTFPHCSKCKLKFATRREDIPPPMTAEEKTEREHDFDWILLSFAYDSSKNPEFRFCPKCAAPLEADKRSASASSLRLKTDISGKAMKEEHHEGAVKMTGGRWGRLRTRYCVVHGKFLYVYKDKGKEFPDDVVFIQGYFGEYVRDRSAGGAEHVVQFTSPSGSSGKTVKLHFKNKEVAEEWLVHLERAARTVDIKRFYKIREKLGKGTFAQVYYATEIATKREVAVKVIEKKLIDAKQKEYLRIELSIMKLVKHPNVISLERVFETRHHVYMAMPLYPGGDLFDFMKAYRREGVSEDEGRKLIWNILHALKYLHGIGIVHRDLKPENLLLKKKDSPCDVVITDFGLSKFAAPHEAMQAACGTLTYVAPEVLRMEGYGKQVDVWSTGIIMYLVLRAKLPFHDSTKQRIIARILRQKVQLTDPVWKEKSSEAKDLIGLLLEKEPSKRITTKAALEHPWFEPLREAIALASAKGGAAEEKEAVKDVTIESDIDRMASGASIMMIRQLTRRREKMAIPAFDEDEEE